MPLKQGIWDIDCSQFFFLEYTKYWAWEMLQTTSQWFMLPIIIVHDSG